MNIITKKIIYFIIIFSICIAFFLSFLQPIYLVHAQKVEVDKNKKDLSYEVTFNNFLENSPMIITNKNNKNDFIKWVDLKVPLEILKKAINYDIEARKNQQTNINFCELIAYITSKNGNSFSIKRDLKRMNELVNELKAGKTIGDINKNKYFYHYLTIYNAIFKNLLGYKNINGEKIYGVNLYSPIAKGYYYSDYDDFGASRSFGYKRRHLGHDMFASTGTPIVAIEGGTITELGWNRFGGWRIGIRSDDTKRYYYYAHLRRKKPYAKGLKLGDKIVSGQHIGYVGNTGYSSKEDSNMSCNSHLHVGIQLIFDKSQEKGSKEIWINLYQYMRLLSNYRSKIKK